jgi:hypothetical protein
MNFISFKLNLIKNTKISRDYPFKLHIMPSMDRDLVREIQCYAYSTYNHLMYNCSTLQFTSTES